MVQRTQPYALWVSLVVLGVLVVAGWGEEVLIRASGFPHPASAPEELRAPSAGPAPRWAEISISTEQESYASGEPVRFQIRFRNVGTETVRTVAAWDTRLAPPEPTLLLRPRGVWGQPPLAALPLSFLPNQTVAPGQDLTGEVVWEQKAPPGWYTATISHVDFELPASPYRPSIGGSGADVLIRYPPGQALVRSVDPAGQADLHGITLTVPRVECTERATVLHFHISRVRVPAGFEFDLVRPDGSRERGSGRFREVPEGGIAGTVEFNPTQVGISHLIVEMPRLSFAEAGTGTVQLSGPWRVHIPLGDEP